MKKIFLFLVIVLFLCIFGYLYLKSQKFAGHLKPYLSKKISDYTGQSVEIGRISTDIFNQIILSDITVADFSGKELLRVNKIKVRYSLMELIKSITRGKLGISSENLKELIKEIVIYEPYLRAGLPVSKTAVQQSGSEAAVLPPWKIVVINGKANIALNKNKTVTVENIDGAALLAGYPEVHYEVSFECDEYFKKADIKGNYHLVSQDFSAVVSAREFKLTALQGFKIGENYFDVDSGEAGFNIKVSGNIDEVIKDYTKAVINGEVVLEKMRSGIMEIPSARLNISPERIKIDNGILRFSGNNISISGAVKDYLKEPFFSVSAKGSLSARHLVNKTALKNVVGMFEIDGSFEGTAEDIRASGNLYLSQGSVSDVKVRHLRAYAEYADGNLKIGSGSVYIGNGRLIWEGSVDTGGDMDVRLSANSLMLQDFYSKGTLSGKVSGSVTLVGAVSSPMLESDVTIENSRLFGRELGHINIKSSYSGSDLVIDGFTLDGRYSLKAELDNPGKSGNIQVKKFLLKGLGDSALKAEGEMAFSPLTLDLKIEGKNILTEEFTVIKKFYPDSRGSFNFDGEAEIMPQKFQFNGRISSDDIWVESQKYQIEAGVAVSGKEKMQIKISDLNLNNYLKANAVLDREKEKYVFSKISLTAENAALKALSNIIAGNIEMEGILSGNLEYDSSGAGNGDFSFKNLGFSDIKWGDGNIKVSCRKNEWMLDVFETIREGSFSAEGKIYPEQELSLKLNEYSFKDRKISAEGVYKGKTVNEEYSMGINFSKVRIEEMAWPDIAASGKYKDKKLSALVSAGKDIKCEVFADFGRDNKLESELWYKNIEAAGLLRLFGVKADIAGTAEGSVKAMGSLLKPIVVVQLDLKKGVVSKLPFTLKAEAEYQKPEVKINRFEGSIKDSGFFRVSGGINKDNTLETDINVKSLDLNALAELIGENIAGAVDIDMKLRGTVNAPETSAELSGENVRINNLVFKKLTGSLFLKEKKMRIERFTAKCLGGEMVFTQGEADFGGQGIFRLDSVADFKNISLGPVSLFGKAKIYGESGAANTVNFKIVPLNLLLNRYALSNDLNITYERGILNIAFADGLKAELLYKKTGEIEVRSIRFDKNTANLTGEGVLKNDNFEGSVTGNNINLKDIARILDSPVDCGGKANFNVNLSGKGRLKRAEGLVEVNEGKLNNIDLMTSYCEFSYKDGNLNLKNAYIKDPEYVDIALSGNIGENSDLTVNVNRLSLAVLEAVNSEISKAGGYFKGSLKMTGSIVNPVIDGGLNLSGGRIHGRNFFNKITSIDCDIKADKKRINIVNLSADWKPGKVTGEGYVEFAGKKINADILLKTNDKGVLVKIPYLDIPQSSIFGRFLTLPSNGEPQFTLRIHNTDGNYKVEGEVLLRNTHFTYPPAKSSSKAPRSSILDNVILDINLKAGESVWYENTYARVEVDGGLNFKKYPEKKIIINGVVTSGQGEVTYFNRDFRLKQAELQFEDTVEYLSAVASADIQKKMAEGVWEDNTVELIVPQARVAEVQPRLSSSEYVEEKTSEEALQIAIAGTEFEDLSQEERSALLRKEFLRAIDANLTSPLIKSILNRTELVDVAKVDVKVTEDTAGNELMLEGAGLRLGRYFTDKFYLGYYMEVGGVFENKLSLSHELDVLYRLQGSQFVRGRISGKEKFLGLEQQIRF